MMNLMVRDRSGKLRALCLTDSALRMILFDMLTPNDLEDDKSGRSNTSVTVP